ncbi:2-hydroxymuconate tautomerase [Falsiruegeria litorea]
MFRRRGDAPFHRAPCGCCRVTGTNDKRTTIMPIIRVEMFSGRSEEQKRALVRDLTDAFVGAAGGNPDSVHVVITDVDKSNWGSGGQLCSDKFPD